LGEAYDSAGIKEKIQNILPEYVSDVKVKPIIE
jgi:hypothetical protein